MQVHTLGDHFSHKKMIKAHRQYRLVKNSVLTQSWADEC